MSLKRTFQQNLLLKSVKISNKHDFSSYYSRNKQKLPPILQSKNIFLQHLIKHQRLTNQVTQPSKAKSLQKDELKSNICLKRKPQTYRSIQHFSNFTKTIIQCQPKSKIMLEDYCFIQQQKKSKNKNIYVSATKLNLQIACRRPRAYSNSKEKTTTQKSQLKLKEIISSATRKADLQTKIQLQKIVLSSKIGFLTEENSPNKAVAAGRLDFIKKQEDTSLRKRLRTCIYDQQQKISTTSRKFISQLFAKKGKNEFGNKSVTEQIYSQNKTRPHQLSSLDEKLQSLLFQEKVEPWSYHSPPEIEMIGDL